MAQERRVPLANGQYITIVQTTGTSSGDVMSQSAVTAALSAKSDVGHTHATTDITSGTFGSARIADGAVTTVKVADGAITRAKLGSDISLPSTSYETVIVSGLTSGGTAAVGAEVTIGGDLYRFDSTGVVSAQIPYGQIYKVKSYQNNIWLGGYEAAFTANTSSRSISITYIELNGAFIEATDGMLYTSNEWVSSKTANSIVVAGDGIRFRIALTELSVGLQISGSSEIPFEKYMTEISSTTKAMADYDGAGNTEKIIRAVPSATYADYAAGYCNNFIFPDGKTKGFLPSLGQLYLAYQNKASVDAALAACGGTAMNTSSYYWSSTFYGISYNNYRSCWTLSWSDGSRGNMLLNSSNQVRPLATY